MPLRSPYDREIARLALPALGTLAAEPSYLLVDTAMVGHIDAARAGQALASLALASSVLATLAGLGVVAAYATTAAVARLAGASGSDGRHADDLRRIAAQSLWLGLALGAVGALIAAAAGPLWVEALGGRGATADGAVRYLRIAAPGLAFALLSMAAQGWLRGTGDLRSPLVIVLIGNAVNLVLNPLLIFSLDLGLDGSAIATLVGQTTMGLLFVRLLWRGSADPAGTTSATRRRPSLALLRRIGTTGAFLLVRSGALLLTFAVASAVAARAGDPSLAAHQIGWQLFLFIALVLDALAIAGQVLIGRALGAERTDDAFAASARMVLLTVAFGTAVAVVLLVGQDPIVGLFTDDAAVRERAHAMWPLLCLMLPLAAAVFAFDGVLIGAGDARFLALAMTGAAVVGVPVLLLAQNAGWGIVGVWAGINAVILARAVGTGWRYRGRGWARTGAWR
ncbi:MAG: MATE family efflux transporter [Patulibacter sp.]|nr:MATE family efflux transporter [Patulibacter sp.]